MASHVTSRVARDDAGFNYSVRQGIVPHLNEIQRRFEARRTILRRKVPWSLWAWGLLMFLGAISISVSTSGPVLPLALFPVLMLVWTYFLIAGVRWLWIVTLLLYLLSVPEMITGSLRWQGYISVLLGAILLLLPNTRRYFSTPLAK